MPKSIDSTDSEVAVEPGAPAELVEQDVAHEDRESDRHDECCDEAGPALA